MTFRPTYISAALAAMAFAFPVRRDAPRLCIADPARADFPRRRRRKLKGYQKARH